MKLKKLVLVFSALLLSASICEAKKMCPVNIDKGEMFNDVDTGCQVALSEENCGEGSELSLKLTFSKDAWAGEYHPKRNNWQTWKALKFNAFNSLASDVTLAFVIKDGNSTGTIFNLQERKKWPMKPFILKPGMNKVELLLKDIKNQAGEPSGLEKMQQWFFSYKFFPGFDWEDKGNEAVVFLSNLRLED